MTRELSEILWRIVDEGNDRAFDQFVARYPELREEAEKRRRTAGRLRAARPSPHAPRVAPKRETRRSVPAIVWPSLAIGVLAFVGFLVVRPAPERPVVTRTAPSSQATFYEGPPRRTVTPGEPRFTEERPGTVLRNARLQDAIVLLASQQGKKAEIAPGFGQERIDVTIPSTGDGALQELGERYGFTAFDQGDGTYLVIPAREGSSNAQESEPL